MSFDHRGSNFLNFLNFLNVVLHVKFFIPLLNFIPTCVCNFFADVEIKIYQKKNIYFLCVQYNDKKYKVRLNRNRN